MAGKLARLLNVPAAPTAPSVEKTKKRRGRGGRAPKDAAKARKRSRNTPQEAPKEDSGDEQAEQEAQQLLAGKSAYEALVGLFANKQSKHSGTFKRLIQEQEGDSEGGDSEDDGEDAGGSGSGSEGGEDGTDDDEELDPDMDLDNLDSDELDELEAKLLGKAPPAAKKGAKTGAKADGKANGSNGKGAADGDGAAANGKAGHGSADDGAVPADEHPAPSEEDEEGGSSSEDEAAGAGNGNANGAAASGNGAASGPDTWEAHFSKALTDSEIAALAAAKVVYADASSAAASSSKSKPEKGKRSSGGWQVAGCTLPAAPASLAAAGVKERLQARWREVHKDDASSGAGDGGDAPSTSGSDGDFASPYQASFFALLNSYVDVLHTGVPYPSASANPAKPGSGNPNNPTNPQTGSANPQGSGANTSGEDLLDATLLHCLNHVTKAADRIKKNNDRIKAAGEGTTDVPRDQGFTRPKVLILLPMRNFAFTAVRRLVALAQKETRADSVQGKERFVEQFADPNGDDDDEVARKRRALKPAEHQALFAGNLDDHFRLGIKLTRGSIKLFADLYDSDIVVASPIALATKLAEDKKASEHSDFLSSIEVLVLHRADVLGMQNWAHVQTVVDHLNLIPRQQHGSNIMRVREWYLSGWGRHYRQSIVTSSFLTPDLNALFNRTFANHAGKARHAVDPAGVLTAVIPQVRQMFERFSAPSPADAAAARLAFFKSKLWPRLRESGASGLLIFVPSYFDFVRLRNFLRSDASDDVAELCEYTKHPDMARGRAFFFKKTKKIMLYTERAHFYNRFKIRGIKDILFYGLPDHCHYYSELVNLLEESDTGNLGGAHQGTVTALFTKYDALALGRVVGAGRAAKMLSNESSTFVFC